MEQLAQFCQEQKAHPNLTINDFRSIQKTSLTKEQLTQFYEQKKVHPNLGFDAFQAVQMRSPTEEQLNTTAAF